MKQYDHKKFGTLLLICFLVSGLRIQADSAQAPEDERTQVLQSLKFQTGNIDLPGGVARLKLPPEMRYLGPDDSEKLLTKVWGNSPDAEKPLGMLFPTDDRAWGVIITYSADGYVKDDDADKINYHDLLKSMQEQIVKENPERVRQGYPSVKLVGWAVAPRYDRQAKTMYWAKELIFDDSKDQCPD